MRKKIKKVLCSQLMLAHDNIFPNWCLAGPGLEWIALWAANSLALPPHNKLGCGICPSRKGGLKALRWKFFKINCSKRFNAFWRLSTDKKCEFICLFLIHNNWYNLMKDDGGYMWDSGLNTVQNDNLHPWIVSFAECWI